MEDFKKRLKVEREELNNKIIKLGQFVNSDKFKTLDDENRTLLLLQHYMMNQYLEVLDKRISLLIK